MGHSLHGVIHVAGKKKEENFDFLWTNTVYEILIGVPLFNKFIQFVVRYRNFQVYFVH